jgi:ubiquinone/menaquinone biosynthesis C-methylase UbiE
MQRVNHPEAMDGSGLDTALLAHDLRNLELLNRLFAGQSVVRKRVRPLLESLPTGAVVELLDIGSGAGDLCAALLELGRETGRMVRLTSLDAHPQIQAYARERLNGEAVQFLRGDARAIPLRDGAVDLAICTLALHHFAESDAAAVLAEMRRVSRKWAMVSDLARGEVAYGAVWFATRFTRNPMTRLDGPLSVQRAYTPAELRTLGQRAGWSNARLEREPWFRMTMTYSHPEAQR